MTERAIPRRAISPVIIKDLWSPGEIYAYLAGLFDGEGSINMHNRIHHGANEFDITLRIGGCDRSIPDLFKSCFGFGYVTTYKPNNPRARPCFLYIATQRKVLTICKILIKYLHTKKPQVDLVIQFYNLNKTALGRRLTPEELRIRNEFEARSKELNKRGLNNDRKGPS